MIALRDETTKVNGGKEATKHFALFLLLRKQFRTESLGHFARNQNIFD